MANLLELLTQEERKLINSSTYEKDQIIFHEDSLCENLGIIVTGSASIISYSFEGQNILFRTLQKHDTFGENLIFSKNPFYKGNVIATSKVKIAFISKNNLIKFLQENKNFLIEFLNLTSEFAKELNSKIKILSFTNAEERFYYFMHEHKNVYAMKNITSFSNELGITRETLSRLLTKLELDEKIIILNKKISLIE